MNDLLRLLDSIAEAKCQHGLATRHYILLQRASDGVPSVLQVPVDPTVRLLAITERVCLSRARNILLARALADGVLASALWVAFPDDDAWYPTHLLNEVNALFANSASVDLVTCSYGAEPQILAPGAGPMAFRPLAGLGELVRTVSSNTLMLRASVVESIGGFDERLGLGAAINGGEDLDYTLRACVSHARHVLLSAAPLVGHRDRMRWVRSRYFAGSLFALSRGARKRPALVVQVMRKLLVGLTLVALRELSAADLCTCVRTGLSGWRLQPEVS
jgi:hypothetical protein